MSNEDIIDEQVYKEEDYLIVFSRRPFAEGYNVYKLDKKLESDKLLYKKHNDLLSWFTSLDEAKKYIRKNK